MTKTRLLSMIQIVIGIAFFIPLLIVSIDIANDNGTHHHEAAFVFTMILGIAYFVVSIIQIIFGAIEKRVIGIISGILGLFAVFFIVAIVKFIIDIVIVVKK